MSMRTRYKRRGIFRPRNVAMGDERSPLLRLLQDGRTTDGHIEVCYAAQWPTFFKAQRLGYVDDRGDLTESGKAWIAIRQCEA